ncbi:MAG: NAD-dependent epimerase/dehydratase family protein, partial [Chloroflexi bacterium]
FHLANLYSMWEPDPVRFSQVNIAGTRDVLETALETGIKKVVYVSTVAIFGKPDEDPFNEASCPGPKLFSEYARTKAAANQIAWDLYSRRGLPLVVLYPGIVLGAGDEKASGHYIQDIIRQRVPSTIFHNSSATYVYVGDMVEAMLRAAEKLETVGQRYLIGRQVLDGRAYANLISEISGVPLPLFRFPDWMVLSVAYLLTGIAAIIKRPPLWGLSVDAGWTLKMGFRCDGSKAERELGIHYTPIRRALEEAIESYLVYGGSPELAAASSGDPP